MSELPKRRPEKAAVLWSNPCACSKPGPLKREPSKGRVMLEVDEHRMSVSKDSDVSVAWLIALAAVARLLAFSLVSQNQTGSLDPVARDRSAVRNLAAKTAPTAMLAV